MASTTMRGARDGRYEVWTRAGHRARRIGRPLVDSVAWSAGLALAVAARYDGELRSIDGLGLLAIIGVAVTVQWVVGCLSGLYRGRYEAGSVDEAVLLAVTVLGSGVLVLLLDVLLTPPPVPRSAVPAAAVVALALAAGARLAVRVRREAGSRPDDGSAVRVLVYGAGRTGEQLLRSMRSDPACGLRPVALIDDDPALSRRRLCGVAVRGTGVDLAAVAVDQAADLLVVAMRAPDPAIVRRATDAANGIGLRVQVLPPLGERLKPTVGVADLRDLDVTALLGRAPVDPENGGTRAALGGRRVLVTGAGGSIGSELCRQIARFDPAELVMLDRDESALHAVQLSVYGTALLDSPDVVLADLRDEQTIDEVFGRHRPEVVFHAAALKHLPMLEQYPDEGWKTNVIGTATVLEAAHRHGVEHLVNISTDKAADPTSVLGRSKRVGERMVAGVADATGDSFVSVRFGNVLGSRGSVIHTFMEQLSVGAPLTVTHPDVSRYFMTIPEAVHLVLQATAVGSPGEVLVLDMGARIRIIDVARQLMEFTGLSSPVVYTGLRPGEKLHEDLFGPGEQDHRPRHPLIAQVPVPPLHPDQVRAGSGCVGSADAMAVLCDRAGELAASADRGLVPVPTTAVRS